MALFPRRKRTGEIDQDFLDSAASIPAERTERYSLFQDYYDGEHNTKLNDRAREYLEVSNLTFCENFCETIVDVLAERLTLTGFQTNGPEETGPDGEMVDVLASAVREWWERGRMDATQGIVHTNTLVYGDGYVIVDWLAQAGRPRWVWNRPHGIKIGYADDDPSLVEWAAKRWVTAKVSPSNQDGRPVERLNLYWPDRVEKFFRIYAGGSSGGWAVHSDEGDQIAGQVPWTRPDGSPRGIPVFHFANKPLGQTVGRSELRNAIPQQELLNKQVIDLAMILDQMGMPQDFVTGVDKDNAVFDRSFDLWVAYAADASFGRLPPTDPTGALEAIMKTLERMAKRSRIPMHLLTGGDMPSGEALKSAEAGLVAKALDRQTSLGNVWEDAVSMALILAADFGKLPVPLPDNLIVRSVWRDPEARSDKDEAEQVVLLVQNELISRSSAMARLGLDPAEENSRMAEERQTLDNAAGRLLDAGAGA